MKKYRVNVNGVDYEIALEALKDGEDFAPKAAPAPAAAPAPVAAPAPAPAAAPAPAGAQGSVQVTAPMPGTIVKVNVTVGAAIKKGDTLCVLEAMKMENEIKAPEDGTVASVNVQSGASVSSGEVIITLN